MRSGIERRSSASKVRIVPVRVTSSGITLKAWPPWMAPTVTTADCSGETSRDDDGLERGDDVGGGHDGVGRALGLAAVAAAAVDHDPQSVDRGHERARLHPERAHRQLVPEVDAEGEVDALQHAVRDHGLGSALALLGRLEEQAHAPGQARGRPACAPRAAPMAAWPSWPQACITPGTREA